MKKRLDLKKLLSKNKELLFGIVIGLIMSSTAVFGLILYSSSNVFYKNTDSHLSATTLQAAIDELYTECTTRAYTLTADSKGGTIPATSGWSISGSTATKPVLFNGTYGTLPEPTKTGYSFVGWYTQESGGTEVDSETKYKINSDSTIHAHWNKNSYTIGYTLNGGSYGTSHPTSGTFEDVVTINNPTKTVTVTGNVNGTGANIGSSTSGVQTFEGWTYSNGTTSTAKYGTTSTNVNTSWSSGSTKVTAEYFKNLRSSSGTVTLTANWTPVAFNLPTISKDGYTCKWNTKADGTGTDYDSGASYTPEANSNASVDMYAKCTGNTYTATFYYQSNISTGSTTISNEEESCTVTSGSSCTVDVPSQVRNSGGTNNNAYAGLSTSTGNMTEAVSSSATTVTLSANTTYYSIYRTKITIAYPTSVTVATTKDTYQNQWFTSNSAMATTVLSTTTTGTSTNATYGTLVSGYSLVGFGNTPNGMVVVPNISTLAQSNSNKNATRTVYQTEKDEDTETVTFYYQTSSTNGTCNVGSKTKTGTTTATLRCSSTTEAVGLLEFENITVPTEVTNSVGQYNNAYAGVSIIAGSMAATPAEDIDTSTLTYYAIYRTNVTNYYWDGSKYTSRTLYRNMAVSSTSACGTTYLSSSSGSSSNYTTSRGPGSSAWAGLSTGNDTTPEYTTVAGAAQSNSTTLYTVYQFNVTYTAGSNVSSVGSTSGSCKIASSATANATTPDSCDVTLPSITPNSGYTSIGWNTTNGATNGTEPGQSYTINYNPKTLYANAYPSVTYNAGATCSSATGMPATHANTSSSVTIQAGTPSCDGKVFLGWSTTSSATGSSTWYDGGTTYSVSGGLTLYAQFYDVNSLENWYTTVLQSGDWKRELGYKGYSLDNTSSNSWKDLELTTNCETNYTKRITITGWNSGSSLLRPFRVALDTMGIRFIHSSVTTSINAAGSETSGTRVSSGCSRNRSRTTYSDGIDTRIQRLIGIEDVAVKYSEVVPISDTEDNVSISSGRTAQTVRLAIDKGYIPFTLAAGHNIVNATTNGTGASRVYQWHTGNTVDTGTHLASVARAYSSVSPVVKHTVYGVEIINNKQAERTFNPGNDENAKGLDRYNALVSLENNKNNYFSADDIHYTRVEGNHYSLSSWQQNYCQIPISISSSNSNDKILGIGTHAVSNYGSSGANSSFGSINKMYVAGAGSKSGTLHMRFYAGNGSYDSATGTSMTDTYAYAYVIFISKSDTLTVGTKSCEHGSY